MVTEALHLVEAGPGYNPVRALKLLEVAEKSGNVDAAFNRGLLIMTGRGVEKSDKLAVPHFKFAAECGHTLAQFNLAQILLEEGGSSTKSAYWFEKAAAQGHVVSSYNLGLMYARGYGVKKDLKKAESYFRKAADAGHVDAMYNLGYLYDELDRNIRDDKVAFRYYSLAAERNHPSAQSKLAVFYGLGRGVKKDEGASIYWLRRSANNGDKEAAAILSQMK